MFKNADDVGTKKQTKAAEPASLMEDELDEVVGAGDLRTVRDEALVKPTIESSHRVPSATGDFEAYIRVMPSNSA